MELEIQEELDRGIEREKEKEKEKDMIQNVKMKSKKFIYLVPNFDDLMRKYIFCTRLNPYPFPQFMEDTGLTNTTLTALIRLYKDAYREENMEFSVMDQYVLKSIEDIRREKNSLGKLVSSLEKMEKDD
jgi:hypothetical protein